MRKLWFALPLLLLMATVSHAATLTSWDTDVTVNDDGTSEWKVSLSYNGTVNRDDYWIFARATFVQVTVDGKEIRCLVSNPELGTSIVCSNIEGSLIEYTIRTDKVVDRFDNFQIFSRTLPATRLTDKFTATVRIPLGAALAEASRLRGTGLAPFEPSFGQQGTDGRRIFVSWALQTPKLGETLTIRVIYEPLVSRIDGQLSTELLLLLIAVAVGVFSMLIWKLRMRAEHVLPVLVGGERTVMELILKNKNMDQRDIVRETDFSKAKVSRIVKSLGERGLVKVEPKGRTKKITLSLGKKEEKKEPAPEKKANVPF